MIGKKSLLKKTGRGRHKKHVRFKTALLAFLMAVALPFTWEVWLAEGDSVFAVSQTEAFVQRLYQTVFDRKADEEGLRYWVMSLENGSRSGTDVSENFLLSAEMEQKSLSDEQFLEVLYNSMMDRPSDIGGKNYWLNYLENGCARSGILRQFLLSPEFTRICAGYGIQRGTPQVQENRDRNLELTMFVNRQYEVTLGRTGEIGGLNYWTGRILYQGITLEDVAWSFIFSDEFAPSRADLYTYMETLYRAFMNRIPHIDEVNHWLYQMHFGYMTRRDVFDEFVYSAEFQGMVRSMGLQPSPRPPAPWLGVEYEVAMADEFIERLNMYRDEHGSEPLRISPALMEAAYIRAEEMSESETHFRPDGRYFDSVLDQVGYDQLNVFEWIGWISTDPPITLSRRVIGLTEIAWENGAFLAELYENVGVGVYVEEDGIFLVALLGNPDTKIYFPDY